MPVAFPSFSPVGVGEGGAAARPTRCAGWYPTAAGLMFALQAVPSLQVKIFFCDIYAIALSVIPSYRFIKTELITEIRRS